MNKLFVAMVVAMLALTGCGNQVEEIGWRAWDNRTNLVYDGLTERQYKDIHRLMDQGEEIPSEYDKYILKDF